MACSYIPAGPLPLPPIVNAQVTPGPGPANGLFVFNNEIRADTGTGNTDCGGTVFNTGLITLGDASPGGSGNVKIFRIPVDANAILAPGTPNEAGSSDEIEFGVAFGPGTDVLGLKAPYVGGGPSTIRLGTDGEHDYINLNAAESNGVDQDVSMEGVDKVVFESGISTINDDIRGIGGKGTGEFSFSVAMQADPGRGDDVVIGGRGHDNFDGGIGADTLGGGGGPDDLFGGYQPDRILGGSGRDLLVGDPGDDTLDAGAGADQAYGESGAETIRGGRGNDLLKGGGSADVLIGGPGFDRCVGGAGNDTFVGCEKVTP